MMTMAKPRSLLWSRWAPLALTVVLATVAVDQASKWWILSVYELPAKGRVEVLPFLDLVFVRNIGISYSLFNQDSVLGQNLLAGFAFVASIALWAWLNRAIGNAIDRLRIGGVADFFSLHAYGYYWYVFNIADVAIVAGVAGLLYESLLGESQ